MVKKLLFACLVMAPVSAYAESSISVSYANQSGTIKSGSSSVNATVTGYSLSGRVDLTDSLFLGVSTTSGDTTLSGALTGKLDNTITEYGVGYYLTNDLDRMAGTGSYFGVGLAISNVEVKVGTSSAKSNSESIISNAGFAIGSGLVATLGYSAQTGSSNSSTGIGVEYSVNENIAFSVGYSSNTSKSGTLSSDASGYSIGVTFGL